MALLKNNIKEILESRGIKQKWLAEKSGVNEKTLSNCISERHDISLINAMKIAKVLDMTVDELFTLTTEENDEIKNEIKNGKM